MKCPSGEFTLAENSQFIPLVPKLDPGLKEDGTRPTLRANTLLDDEALSLLEKACNKTKADCKMMIETIAKHSVKEDDILDGAVHADKSGLEADLVNGLTKKITEDVYTINNFVDDARLPKTTTAQEEEFWDKHWKLLTDNSRAAKLELPQEFNSSDDSKDKAAKLLSDAESVYQSIDVTLGEVLRLSTSSNKNWNELARRETTAALIRPLKATVTAIKQLNQAESQMQWACDSGRGEGMFNDLGGFRYIVDIHPAFALVDIGTSLFGHAMAARENNKQGRETLPAVRECVKAFHRALDEYKTFLEKSGQRSDEVTLQKIVKMNDDISQMMPEIDQLNDMAGNKKHASWKKLDQALSNIQQRVASTTLYKVSRELLDQSGEEEN